MSQIKKQITLSQGLKYVERLTRLVDESYSDLQKLIQPVTISFASEQEKVEQRQKSYAEQVAKLAKLNGALTTLRTKIGEVNGNIGLHKLLGEQAVLRKNMTALESLEFALTHHQGNAIEPGLIGEALTRLERKEELPRIQVKVVDEQGSAQITAAINEHNRKIMSISDEIHRLNGTTVFEFELPQDTAEMIGITA